MVSNELNELQTQRLTSPAFTLLTLVRLKECGRMEDRVSFIEW